MNMDKNAEFSDSDLLMFIDGEMDEFTAEAIRQSSAAMERVALLARSEERLGAVLNQATRPDSTVLGEYLLGMLDRDEMAVVAQYLAQNPTAQAEVNQMAGFLDDLGHNMAFEPITSNGISRIRLLVAHLLDDLQDAFGPGAGSQLAMAGMRGNDTGPLQYEAEEFQISVDIKEDSEMPGARVILGLMLGAEPAGWQVELRQEGQRLAVEPIDELGNFTFTGVHPGRYTMRIGDGQTEVHIEAFDVA